MNYIRYSISEPSDFGLTSSIPTFHFRFVPHDTTESTGEHHITGFKYVGQILSCAPIFLAQSRRDFGQKISWKKITFWILLTNWSKEIGKSWYDADQEHRQRSGRLSITRILFACLVSPSVRKTPKTGGDIDTDTMDTTIRVIEEKKRENTERERSDDIASGPLHFVMEMIQKDIDTKVRGGIAPLCDGDDTKGHRYEGAGRNCPPLRQFTGYSEW